MAGVQSPVEGVTYPSSERARAAFGTGSWIDLTLGDALRATARRFPDRPAFIGDDRRVSFRELDETTDRLAAGLLRLGLLPGDRAIFQLGTTVETVIVLLGCFKAGIVPVCSLPQHREVEIGELTRQTGARAYFVQADFGKFDLVEFAHTMIEQHESLQHLIVVRGQAPGAHALDTLIQSMTLSAARDRLRDLPLGSEDVLSFQLSGGTTGLPKIIPRFHAEYLGHSSGWMRRYQIDGDSRIIWTLPLLHNAGQLYAIVPVVLTGVTTVLMSKVDVRRMLELIEQHKITHAVSIGPIAPQLLTYPDIADHDLSSLELFGTVGRADNLEAHLGLPCSNLFGITEGLLLGSPPDAPAFARHHTHGRSGCADDEIRLLVPETEDPVALGEIGELCFRGPSSLTGFFNNPAANAAAFTPDGFYRTGDLMRAHLIEGDTYYTFEGRLRDNVNRGGEKIGSEEVEAFVSRHPAVADARLVAMPDPFYGEKGCIYIIPRPGVAVPDVKELAAFLTDFGLAKFKCPERIELVEEFPLTRVGKVDKSALKRQITEKLMREQSASGS